MRFPARRRFPFFLIVAILGLAPAPGRAVAPDSHTQPLLDGCQRSQALVLGLSTPEWVYVNAADVRAARLAGDDTAGRRTVEGLATEVRPAGEDLFVTHDFHDFNLFIDPDPAYEDVLSSANLVPGEEQNLIEGEWEVSDIPLWAWPSAGDRVRASGNWNWDCGHWGNPAADPTSLSPLLPYDPVETAQDLASPGAIRGEATELHPLYEVATFRANAAGPLLGYGPRLQSRLDVWINGDGNWAHSIEECALRGITNAVAARAVCPRVRDVGGSYSYTLPLGPKPSRRSRLIVNPTIVHRETHPSLKGLPVSVRPDARAGTVTVSFDLPHDLVPQTFGISVSAGWSDAPRPVLHRIAIERLRIARSLDGASEPQINPAGFPGEQSDDPGEWVLYANVAGRWLKLPGIAQATDGMVEDVGVTLQVWLPRGVRPTVFVSGHECDVPLVDCVHEGYGATSQPLSAIEAGFNDRPGRIEDAGRGVPLTLGRAVYRPRANPDPGSGNEDLSDAVCGPGGCYELTLLWKIARVPRRR